MNPIKRWLAKADTPTERGVTEQKGTHVSIEHIERPTAPEDRWSCDTMGDASDLDHGLRHYACHDDYPAGEWERKLRQATHA